MKFKKKPVVIEAITFEEFIEYGKSHGANIVNGMPWSFEYNGNSVTHETDECYLVPTSSGIAKFTPQDMLITQIDGEIYPCRKDIFEKTYDPVYEPVLAPPPHHQVLGAPYKVLAGNNKGKYFCTQYMCINNTGMCSGYCKLEHPKVFEFDSKTWGCQDERYSNDIEGMDE